MDRRPTETDEFDVAVVGAGPVGMTAALLLESRGLRVVVLEAQTTPVAEPKAISLDDESLRVYQAAGVSDRILEIITPGTGTKYFGSDGKPLFQARGPAPYRLGYPFKNPFAQPDLERLLRDVLDERPGAEVRYGARLTSIRADDDAAVLEVASSGGTRRVRARFAIGADGGRSTVRAQLGIGMTGRSYSDNWLVVDTLGDDHDERYGLHFGTPDRPVVIIPGMDGRCRYEFRLFPGEGEPGVPPSFELMRRLLAQHRSLEADQVQRAVVYRFNAVNADTWRAGSVFLMGDAAHMMPPFAGQGLNSGIRDAANLCWKLAGVWRGDLRADVLDTYETERRPHVQATIALSERLGRVVMTTSPRLAAARDRIIRNALDSPEGRAYLEGMRYRPEARLTGGLVFPGDRPDLAGIPLAQPRVYDTRSRSVVLLDAALGNGWALLGVDVDPAAWDEAAPVLALTSARALAVAAGDRIPRPLDDVSTLVDVDDGLNREVAPFAGRFLLLRPDRVIAATWAPDGTETVRAALSDWFPEVPSEPVGGPPGRRAADTSAAGPAAV